MTLSHGVYTKMLFLMMFMMFILVTGTVCPPVKRGSLSLHLVIVRESSILRGVRNADSTLRYVSRKTSSIFSVHFVTLDVYF